MDTKQSEPRAEQRHLWLKAALNTVTGLFEQLEENLFGALPVSPLHSNLILHLSTHIFKHADQRVLALLTNLLLLLQDVLKLDELIIELLNNSVLLCLSGSPLLVDALTESVNLILHILGLPLLSLFAHLLLLGELYVKRQAAFVHHLHHFHLQLLACSLLLRDLLGQVAHFVI